jgi:adenylosuccinate lyase
MIDRYMPEDLAEIWSEENMFLSWLRVELETCRILAEKGWIPKESMENIEKKADFSVPRIKEIEKITHHDLIAFTTSVAEFVGPDSRYIHWGLTSTDVVDTARGLQLKQAGEKMLDALDALHKVMGERALQHRKSIMMGRTHGVHAEITTSGLKLANCAGTGNASNGLWMESASGKYRARSALSPILTLKWRNLFASAWG